MVEVVAEQQQVSLIDGFKMMAAYVGGDKSVIPANKLDIVPTNVVDPGSSPGVPSMLGKSGRRIDWTSKSLIIVHSGTGPNMPGTATST